MHRLKLLPVLVPVSRTSERLCTQLSRLSGTNVHSPHSRMERIPNRDPREPCLRCIEYSRIYYAACGRCTVRSIVSDAI